MLNDDKPENHDIWVRLWIWCYSRIEMSAPSMRLPLGTSANRLASATILAEKVGPSGNMKNKGNVRISSCDLFWSVQAFGNSFLSISILATNRFNPEPCFRKIQKNTRFVRKIIRKSDAKKTGLMQKYHPHTLFTAGIIPWFSYFFKNLDFEKMGMRT